MKFSVTFPSVMYREGPQSVTRLIRAIEDIGFHEMNVLDHVVMGYTAPGRDKPIYPAQMPLLVRGMFFEGWRPAHTPVRDRKVEHFVSAIEDQVGDVQDWRGTKDIAAVFRTLDDKISAGEIRDVKAGLPQPIRDLWPD